jgi:flagellar protein FliS
VFAQPRGIQAYQQVQTESRSPLELVVMLYDGAIASLSQAHEAAARGDLRQRGAAVSKTLSIVGALREALDLTEGGAVAAELDRLYDYITCRLLDVTARHDAGALTEVRVLLSGVRDAWHQIASQSQQAVSG